MFKYINLILLGFLITSCSSISGKYEYSIYDQNGNLYPIECRKDLSFIKTPVYIDDSLHDQHLKGKWQVFNDGARMILISDRLLFDDHLFNDAIRHERCHDLMYDLYHNADWHK